ncbi:hypothetical protein [Erwinia sorbitola]|uniref:Uncharacterized protein n=1 Tax=Erwinia sorbitola TaxID=2681984 RepID=A0A6I6EG94_9GAMM|nr:hypothetical protein [Erwinia sorbitola]QGU88874.1 hypothetical protein GN242_17330 [Erwinia sorbitola]
MNKRSMVKSKCHMKYGCLNVWQSICLRVAREMTLRNSELSGQEVW